MAQIRITNNFTDGTQLVSLDEMKDHLRVSGADEDTLIKSYMDAACDYMASVSGRTFKYSGGEANVYLYLSRYENYGAVRGAKDLTVYQVRYRNDEDGYTIMDPEDYVIETDTYPATFKVKNVPNDITSDDTASVYRVWFKGGEDVTSLPSQFRIAMMLLVSHYYTNREAEYVGGITTELKEGVKRLLNTVKNF